jgi:predicted ester cyclase
MWNTVFSQNRFEIKEQISDGDTVATRVVLKAVHSEAEFQGVPPTGKQIETPGITIERIKDGKIVERHVCSDRLGMMQQLGLMPSP